MAAQRVVLTDVANDLWLDEFHLSSKDDLLLAGSADWSISKKTLLGGVSQGVDVVEINNGAFAISVLPTRGMGLWRGQFGDVGLGWKSPVTWPVNPAFVNLTAHSGSGWLTGFNELLCRCGLAWNGAPGTDVVLDDAGAKTETPLTLHGRIANIAAHRVEVAVSTEAEGSLSVTGVVDETTVFGPCLRLASSLSTKAGSNRICIDDTVTNLSGQDGEMELLYHTNFGAPLLQAGSEFVAPCREIAPTDARAAEDIENWAAYRAPTAGYTEQCYFTELIGDDDDETLVLLKNAAGENGVSLNFNRQQLPCFTIWKNTQAEADGYVTGLEPGTSLPNLKTFERQQGRVVSLSPGESYCTRIEMAVHETSAAVAQIEAEIAVLQERETPTVHQQPLPRFSPMD